MSINAYRRNELDWMNNKQLGRILWALVAGGVSFIAVYVVGFVTTPEATGSALDFAPTLHVVKVVFVGLILTMFSVSLVYPARRAEKWLDERFPKHAAEEDIDYSIEADVVASLGGAVEWAIYLAAVYGVISLVFYAVTILSAIQERGYQISAADTRALTVMNSAMLLIIGAGLAGIGLIYLTKRWVKPFVADLRTTATWTLSIPESSDQEVSN